VQPGIDSDFLGLPSMTAWSIGAQHANLMDGLAQCCLFPFNPQSVIENELVPRLHLRAFCPTGGRGIASPCPSPTPIAWSAIVRMECHLSRALETIIIPRNPTEAERHTSVV
jgi:hypothetical protein